MPGYASAPLCSAVILGNWKWGLCHLRTQRADYIAKTNLTKMQKWIFSLPLLSHPSSPIFYNANLFQKPDPEGKGRGGSTRCGKPREKGGRVCFDWLSFGILRGFCECFLGQTHNAVRHCVFYVSNDCLNQYSAPQKLFLITNHTVLRIVSRIMMDAY